MHPYNVFERRIRNYLDPSLTLLDAGCGRTAPLAIKFKSILRRTIAADLVDFDRSVDGMADIELLCNDLSEIELDSNSVDLVISRSVMEHLQEPLPVYASINRVLKDSGHFIFLTPNVADYVSIFAKLIPNKFHPWIVSKVEGRNEEDTFPTFYRSNSFLAISRLARRSGFELVSLEYLSQVPSCFQFNVMLFMLAMGYEIVVSRVEKLKYLRSWLMVVLRKRHRLEVCSC